MDQFTPPPQRKKPRLFLIVTLFIVVCFFALQRAVRPPTDFPAPYQLTIESGQTLFSISNELVRDHVIRSPRVFEMLMLTLGNDKTISEGEYLFEQPISALGVAFRISTHYYGIDKKKITFPEGFTRAQMATRVGEVFSLDAKASFLRATEGKEGDLFPDTYSFFPTVKGEYIAKALMDTFNRKLAILEKDIRSSGRSRNDIITMASIVEREAHGEDDRAMIAGILWKRLDNNMPLQVDASLLYALGKDAGTLSAADFKKQSPYNTYIHIGLPPTPIANPGLLALRATLAPTKSPYLYYLHDKSGTIHYAKTYAEHQANITRYLK